ncbi:hypothetical protein [Phenylobacterium sp.]|uniref:hypothetical protein n=1 Tax=Phenylobacterium sp. TaxID=1871053 RepID=UPI0025DF9D41|nr:hypothetical protein [Phenylobacterium sp.]MBX3483349.1 hypothetical protein [Phenylobacterium sp.]
MSAFDLTDADAQGLDALAASQLRLALRFAERAEAAEDDDAACRLARTSERAARSYRQILLVKSKLKRERDAALRDEAAAPPAPPGPQEQQRIDQRRRDVYERVERIACETLDDEEDIAFGLDMAWAELEDMAQAPGFADGDIAEQVERVLAAAGFEPEPDADPAPEAPVPASEPADSS